MNILFVSSELSPYASTGGLADVASALPKALLRQNVPVQCVMPLYRRVFEGGYAIRDTGIRLNIPLGLRALQAEVWKTEGEEPVIWFIRRDEYFDRRELYSIPERDYEDNFERFVFFQKAVVALMDKAPLSADIVHANDWQTGLIPSFLQYGPQGMGREMREHTVYTIHNLAYQGVFPGLEFSSTNLPFSCFSLDTLEFYGNINCMKGGITMGNRITTVSPRYAREILTPEFGCGLEGVLSNVQDRLVGILNGVDYDVWNPATDSLIAAAFSSDRMEGKMTCKKDLLQAMGLTRADPARPVIGMIGRLVDQKGLDLLAEIMPDLMTLDVSFVLLGSGQEMYQQKCQEWQAAWPDRFAVYLGFNNELAHKIEAGSDLFLMPSRFEPCGLNQMYSLKYGTVPIVHAVGGLDDTIEDAGRDPARSGNGFKFNAYTSAMLLQTIQRALAVYAKPDLWRKVQLRGMTADYSWNTSARAYIKLYESLMA